MWSRRTLLTLLATTLLAGGSIAGGHLGGEGGGATGSLLYTAGILALWAASTAAHLRAAAARAHERALQAENERLLEASRHEALADGLTGLSNRRALIRDLDRLLSAPGAEHVLAIFDLDGFKPYNDAFGHAAGDALLARLGHQLACALERVGRAYRLGGDEFCVLARVRADDPWLVERAAQALTASGEGFDIGCSYGRTLVPTEAPTASEALRLADERLHEQKAVRGGSARREGRNVLRTLLAEHQSGLVEHSSLVAQLAVQTARRLNLAPDEVALVREAAELHDIGKVAIPATILSKPGSLTPTELELVRQHTLVGERIVRAAPSLARVAAIIRSTHECFDGQGYPDRLAGDDIPLGARIIAVCDAFTAMVSDRPYESAVDPAVALAELRRQAGTRFDPIVVRACAHAVEDGALELDALAA